MSREQLTESQGELEQGGPDAAAPAQSHQLPLHVFNQVAQIRPGDAVGLHALLAQYPDLAQNIAAVASHHAGMSTVKQAMAMQSGGAALPHGGLTQADIRPGGEFALEGGPPSAKTALPHGGLTQADIRPGGEFALEGGPPSAKTALPHGGLTQADIRPGGEFALEGGASEVARPAATHAEAPWIASARRFNDAHAHLVDEFNDLTNNVLALDDVTADPQAIARWQRAHGIAADGMVGPHTVAAARAKRDNAHDVAKTEAPAPKAEPIDV